MVRAKFLVISLIVLLISSCATAVKFPRLDLDRQYSLVNRANQLYRNLDNENFEAACAMISPNFEADRNSCLRYYALAFLANSDIKAQSLNIVDFDGSIAIVQGNIYYAFVGGGRPEPFFICERTSWIYEGNEWYWKDSLTCGSDLSRRDVLENFYKPEKNSP